jgi:hypothetical protein
MRLAEESETWLLLSLIEPHILVEVVPTGSHLFASLLLASRLLIRCESKWMLAHSCTDCASMIQGLSQKG